MKGYFTNLSKHSVLRHSGESAHARALSVGNPVVGMTPLELDETVLVPPSMHGNVQQAALTKERVDRPKITPEQEPIDNGVQNQKQNLPAQEQLSVQIPEPNGKKVVFNEIKPSYSPNKNSENNSPVMVESNAQQSSASARLSVVGQAILKTPGQSEEASGQTLHREPKQPAGLEAVMQSDLPSAHEPEKKEYFARTAAIIEKNKKGPSDIQAILFQEVQEWAAASPVIAGMVQADVEEPTTFEIAAVSQPKDPGVVTIRESDQPGRVEHIRPMEQNFELSIGTISVIIEESEKPRQPEPPAQQNNKAVVQENGFRFSRLNRSYL